MKFLRFTIALMVFLIVLIATLAILGRYMSDFMYAKNLSTLALYQDQLEGEVGADLESFLSALDHSNESARKQYSDMCATY